MLNLSLMREPTPEDAMKKLPYEQEFKSCHEKGICPTCENKRTQKVFLEDADLKLFQDEDFVVLLEQEPRRSGHIIIIFEKHYEDLSEFPVELSFKFHTLVQAIVQAQIEVLQAKKVYLVTMCDGGPNHLHFQLIPRYEGESHGKNVFVSPRHVIKKDMQLIDQLKTKIFDKLSN